MSKRREIALSRVNLWGAPITSDGLALRVWRAVVMVQLLHIRLAMLEELEQSVERVWTTRGSR